MALSSLPLPPARGSRYFAVIVFVAQAVIIATMKRIVIDPNICNGQPVIEGTRITARTVLEFLAAGDSVNEVLEEYPSLSKEDVLECLRFSAELMKNHFTLQDLV